QRGVAAGLRAPAGRPGRPGGLLRRAGRPRPGGPAARRGGPVPRGRGGPALGAPLAPPNRPRARIRRLPLGSRPGCSAPTVGVRRWVVTRSEGCRRRFGGWWRETGRRGKREAVMETLPVV